MAWTTWFLKQRAADALLDGNFQLAAELYTEALDVNYSDAELFAGRAQANIRLGNLSEAVADANRAIRLDPSMSKAHLHKGIALMKLEEYHAAKTALETAVALAPRDSRFTKLIRECDDRITGILDSDEQGSNMCMDSNASTPTNALAVSSGSDATSNNSTHSVSDGVEAVSNMSKFKFDQKRCRQAFAKMVIKYGLPLSFAESDALRRFCASLQPCYKPLSRKTIKTEIMKIYDEEKEKLHHILDELDSRISLTMDLWTSSEPMDYVCLTARFIDGEWKLQKKVLAFEQTEFPDDAEVLFELVKAQILNWNIDKKLCAITLDNASTNNAMVRELKHWLCDSNLLMPHGHFFHVQCNARILCFIVQDGFSVISKFIEKIRKSITYARFWKKKKFKKALVHEHLLTKERIRLDVPTQWNSTFLMLESALELKMAFLYLSKIDCKYVDCPHDNEWEVARHVVECLRIFYDALNLSRTKHVTANLYFEDVCTMHIKLHEWLHSEHIYIQEMAEIMLLKFMKYWEDCNMTFAVACILDPRCKMDYIEYMYEKIYGDDAGTHVQNLQLFLYELYSEYAANISTLTCNSFPIKNEGKSDVDVVEHNDVKKRLKRAFRQFLSSRSSVVSSQKNELDLYLEETHSPDVIGFDVLLWWKGYGIKFPVLSKIARDIFSISATSVASKIAFSTGSRVIDDDRASLLPKTTQALICTQDWLPSLEKDVGTSSENDLDDTSESDLDDTSSESDDIKHDEVML